MSASAISKKKKPAETIAVYNTNNLIHVNTSNLMKFTAGNFLMWCRQIHALFDGYGLAGYLDGTVTVPTQTLTVDNVTTLNPAFTFWRRQDNLVYSAVFGAISTSLQPLVSGATTASELWSTLKSSYPYLYGTPGFGHFRQHQVKQGREGTRSIDEYLQRLTTLFDKLTLLGKIVGLEDQLDQILEGLTSDLNNLSLHQPLSGPQISHIGSTSLTTPSSSNPFPMAQKVKAKGGNGGKVWDDGVHEGVSQIYIQEGYGGGIASIKFDYVKNSRPIPGSTIWFSSGSFTELEYETIAGSTHGDSSRSFTESFDLNPICDEYILSVECCCEEGVIQGLRIKTNIMDSPYMGGTLGTTFELKVSGKKIVGFHGSFDDKKLISLGAYFAPLSPDNLLDYELRKKERKKRIKQEKKFKKKNNLLDNDSPFSLYLRDMQRFNIPSENPSGSNPFPMAQKLEAKGGNGAKVWDDGDHEGVSQIYIQEGDRGGLASIKFDYVKNGQPKAGSTHGNSLGRFTECFDLNHTCDEHILSVKCYYDEGDIQGLVIKTNIRTSAYMGYNFGTTFDLEVKGKKIVGFHGSFDKKLVSLGAYFAPLSPANLLDHDSRA